MTPTNDKVDQSGADEPLRAALKKILEQPQETFSDGKALAAIVKIARAALAATQQAVAASSEPVAGNIPATPYINRVTRHLTPEEDAIFLAALKASANQPVQASNSDPVDGDWYWVQKEDIDRVWKWYPAQRQRNHWNSAQFSGIPLHEVKVGAAISSPSVQAKALTDVDYTVAKNAIKHLQDHYLFGAANLFTEILASQPSAQADVAAVRDAALEEAAKVCSDIARKYTEHRKRSTYEPLGLDASGCAYAIRALKSAAPTVKQHSDDDAVDRFAAAMKAKLAKKRGEGYGGWNDKDDCSRRFLTEQLIKHTEKGDPVDVGNFAMMLHQRGERLSRVKYDGQQRVVAGALFDLMGRLTTRETPITLSSRHEASPAVEAIREFAEARGLKIDNAIVADWQYHVGIDPAPAAQPQAEVKP